MGPVGVLATDTARAQLRGETLDTGLRHDDTFPALTSVNTAVHQIGQSFLTHILTSIEIYFGFISMQLQN